VTDLLTLDAPTDAALLWALVRHRLRAGLPPEAALTGVVAEVAAAAPGSRLNLLLTDGRGVYATAWSHALAVRTEPDAVTVASEPHDELPGWTPVPDQHLLVAQPGHADIRPIAELATAVRQSSSHTDPTSNWHTSSHTSATVTHRTMTEFSDATENHRGAT